MMCNTNGVQENGHAGLDREPSPWGRLRGKITLVMIGMLLLGIPLWVAASSQAVQTDDANQDLPVRELATTQSLVPDELKLRDPRFPTGLSVATVGTEPRMRQEFRGKQEATDQIAREVDFRQQRLVVLKWSGSGQDTFEAVASEGVVTFQFKRGLTRDLRSHCQLFVLDKEFDFAVRK